MQGATEPYLGFLPKNTTDWTERELNCQLVGHWTTQSNHSAKCQVWVNCLQALFHFWICHWPSHTRLTRDIRTMWHLSCEGVMSSQFEKTLLAWPSSMKVSFSSCRMYQTKSNRHINADTERYLLCIIYQNSIFETLGSTYFILFLYPWGYRKESRLIALCKYMKVSFWENIQTGWL